MKIVFTALSLLAAGLVASVANAMEPAGAPGAAPPVAETPQNAKIGKSRSNIQNNKQATPADSKPEPAPEAQGVVKTKTKSNQSND